MTGMQGERSVPIACEGLPVALDAIFLGASEGSAADGAVIAPPHPLYGGSMQSPVVNEVAYALQKAGIASLRFDWRGIGASGGTPSGRNEDADDDYGAALDHIEDTVNGEIVACGYSFGAAAALRAALLHPRIGRALLVAPPPSLLAPGALAELRRPLLVVTGAHDSIAPKDALARELADVPQARLEVLRDTDHFFASGLADLSRLAQEWFAEI